MINYNFASKLKRKHSVDNFIFVSNMFIVLKDLIMG